MRSTRSKNPAPWKRKADRVWVESLEPRQMLTVNLADVTFSLAKQRSNGDARSSAQRSRPRPVWLRAPQTCVQPLSGTRRSFDQRIGHPSPAFLEHHRDCRGHYKPRSKSPKTTIQRLTQLDTLSIQVTDSPPTLSGVPTDPVSANVGQAVTFTAQASDPGAQQTAWGTPGAETLTFSLVKMLPTGAEDQSTDGRIQLDAHSGPSTVRRKQPHALLFQCGGQRRHDGHDNSAAGRDRSCGPYAMTLSAEQTPPSSVVAGSPVSFAVTTSYSDLGDNPAPTVQYCLVPPLRPGRASIPAAIFLGRLPRNRRTHTRSQSWPPTIKTRRKPKATRLPRMSNLRGIFRPR